MGIIFPNAAIARRWDGALQARLLRAPLERFLRSRGVAPVLAGLSQDSDNVARATVIVLEAAITLYSAERPEGLEPPQQAIIGHVACVTSHVLAASIAQPGTWRIAALVSSARLLSPWLGLNEAAVAAASAARRFHKNGLYTSPIDTQIGKAAFAAVIEGNAVAMQELSNDVASRLGVHAAAG